MSSGGRKIALLTPCFWPEVWRGAERIVAELGFGLIRNGERPQLITSHPGRLSRSVEDGLSVLRLPRPPQDRLLARGYDAYLTHLPLSYAALRLGRYDIAHAVHANDAVVAGRWGRHVGRPSVLTYMGAPDWPWLTAVRKRTEMLTRALELCDAVVALSEHAARSFERWLGCETRVIYPGADLEAWGPGPRATKPTIICSAAADEPRKNVGLLIEAFKLLRRHHHDAQLVISEPRSLDVLRRRGIDVDAAGVVWENHHDRSVLAAACANAWVAVLPAIGETFGLVMVEAMACGTPIVGYADAAIPEVIDRPEIGCLFHELRPEALATALEDALGLSEQPQTAAACRARAAEFSADRATERYLDLYRELSGRT